MGRAQPAAADRTRRGRSLAGRGLRSYVPATPAGRTFAFIALVDSIGTGLFLAGSAVFFIRVIGLSASQVGVGLAVAGAVGFLGTVPLGVVADRVGTKRMLVLLQSWRAAWLVALAFTQGWVAFTAVSSCLVLAERVVPAANQAVIAAAVGEADRTRTMAAVRSVRNVGFSIGALLTTPVLASNDVWVFRSIMLLDSLSFVLAVLLLLRLTVPEEPAGPADRPRRSGNPMAYLRGFSDWRYLNLTALNGALSLHMTLLSVAIPLWTVKGTAATAAIIPLLTTLNTVLAVVFQVPFARGSSDPRFGRRSLRRAGCSLMLCCAAMGLAGLCDRTLAIVALVAATVALTAGELWQSVGGWELSYRFAPTARRVEYLSIFSLGVTLQEIAGPLLVALVLVTGAAGWAGLAGLFLLATILVPATLRAMEHKEGSPCIS
ncbi:MAG: MFS transporter [Micromonosporaceae bacterium]|nr:MFS transporter [Micromonosporaceae bacterium]